MEEEDEYRESGKWGKKNDFLRKKRFFLLIIKKKKMLNGLSSETNLMRTEGNFWV